MKGFVQKNGRLTKGGSLPLPVGVRKLGRFFLRYLPRQNGSNGTAEKQTRDITLSQHFDAPHGHNGNGNGNGNEASAPRGIASPKNDATQIDNECPPFLQKLMTELVSSERVETFGSERNGDGRGSPHLSSNGNGASSQHRFAREFDRTAFSRAHLENVGPVSMPYWKRILDITFVSLTLPCWLPLMIVVMLWIKLVSPGPVFFRQARVGYRRRQFMIFKFRTMRVNAETRTHAEYFAHLMEADCPMTKLDGRDPRLITCGRFLRASGLDELPQIFNVFWGDMSIVGPRPCLPHEFERYEPWQQQRVNVVPGLTGYWQVNGKNHTTFSEMIAMDIFYSRNVSPRLDLAIILKTIPALVAQTLESRAVSRAASRPQPLHQTHRSNQSV